MFTYHHTNTTIIILSLLLNTINIHSFSAAVDRFRVSCPSDTQPIQQFDPKISTDEKEIWCAVYRSNNNLPNVLMRDDFFQSMKIATDPNNDSILSSLTIDNNDNEEGIPYQTKPVAIGRLRQKESSNVWILDTLRCIFKKENMDDDCDGGSEHTEAISLCIDTLFSYFLKQAQNQNYKLQCKSTLISSPLVEARGFTPIEKLNKDMTTHCVGNYDVCMEMYADKISSTGLSPMARSNALSILSLLGQLDSYDEVEVDEKDEDEADYDPWASIKRFI